MLLNFFFEILETNYTGEQLISVIKLNPKHEIFDGHFPGNPVTPGVVQIQIVKEILDNYYKRELKLISMSRCKFLKILNPNATPVLTIRIEISREDDLIKAHATGRDNESTYFKLNAAYQ
ncbi:MAG: 3-hydroxyacyl-ACP dehydratase [Bacteroidia bacterium]|nr:3-hydroxyacyl-ACP dehydratase [Bacteroidia bacterium]